MGTYIASYTVSVELRAETPSEAAEVAKKFRASVGIGSGSGYPRGIPIQVRDETLLVELDEVKRYE